MRRSRSAGVLLITLGVAVFAATAISEILALFTDPGSVVYRALIQSFVYEIGPLPVDMVMVAFTFGLKININLLTVMSLMAAYYYWKFRV